MTIGGYVYGHYVPIVFFRRLTRMLHGVDFQVSQVRNLRVSEGPSSKLYVRSVILIRNSIAMYQGQHFAVFRLARCFHQFLPLLWRSLVTFVGRVLGDVYLTTARCMIFGLCCLHAFTLDFFIRTFCLSVQEREVLFRCVIRLHWYPTTAARVVCTIHTTLSTYSMVLRCMYILAIVPQCSALLLYL